MPNSELVTIGAVALITFTVGGLAAVLGVYLLDREGDLTKATLYGLLTLSAVEMVITLLFSDFEVWEYVLIGIWIFVAALLGGAVLKRLPPRLHASDELSATEAELLEISGAFRQASDRLEDLRYARRQDRPHRAILQPEIKQLELECSLLRRRWYRTLKRWESLSGNARFPYQGWFKKPQSEADVAKLTRLRATASTINWWAVGGLIAVVALGLLLLATQESEPLTAAVFTVVIVLVVVNVLVARATSKFAWYGVAVFFSVLLFGTALSLARTIRAPKVQPVALVRKSDDRAICGVYITETDKRVYIGRIQPAKEGDGAQLGTGRIFWVPTSDIDVSSVGPGQTIKSAEARARALTAEIYADRAQEAAPKLPAQSAGTPALKINPRPVTRPHPDEPPNCATASLDSSNGEEGPSK